MTKLLISQSILQDLLNWPSNKIEMKGESGKVKDVEILGGFQIINHHRYTLKNS